MIDSASSDTTDETDTTGIPDTTGDRDTSGNADTTGGPDTTRSPDITSDTDTQTRRHWLKMSAGLFGASLVAGCTGGSDGTETPADAATNAGSTSEDAQDTAGTGVGTETATRTATGTVSPTGTSAGTDAAVETPYSVSIEPMGSVSFESVPRTWVANNGSWADMGVALGLEPPAGVWLTSRYHTQYYDEVPGVSVDASEIVSLYQDGVSPERLYAIDADVHVFDPNFLLNRFSGWDQGDVDDLRGNVGPIFGNCIYAQHYPWHDDYRYYTLYEAFERFARVFKRTDRYQAIESVHDEFQSNLAPHVPGTGNRPAVAVLWGVGNEPEEFYPYVIGDGTGFKHLTDLGVRDALASTDIRDFHGSRAAIDLETLLEVDPPVLLLRGYESMDAATFEDTVVSFLQGHNTAGALTAVRNGEVYRAGGLYQGPITNMVLTERTAGQLYGVDAELFDRDRVAAIVAGDI